MKVRIILYASGGLGQKRIGKDRTTASYPTQMPYSGFDMNKIEQALIR